ncbi:MAG: GAF domain-containing protein [Halobacteriales archaeon]
MDDIRVLHAERTPDPPYDASADRVTVESATSLEEATALVENHVYDVVVTELHLDDGTGFDLVERVRENQPDTGCVLYTEADLGGIESRDRGVVTEFVPKDAPGSKQRLERILRVTAEDRAQTAYPVVEDERDRLDLVDSVDVDSETLETDLDRVAALATGHFDVPMATVSVVREREQVFLSTRGIDLDRVPRQEILCNYTLLEDSVTVVEDTELHPWCDGMEAIHDLGLRFYAGCPVKPGGDLPVGTVCLYDERPRGFTVDDERYLRLLAEDAASKIEAHGTSDGGKG